MKKLPVPGKAFADHLDEYALRQRDQSPVAADATRPTLLCGLLLNLRSDLGSADGKGDNPSSNALKYNIVPPTNSGIRPAATISAISASASRRKSAAE
jgi:hypothetical protein